MNCLWKQSWILFQPLREIFWSNPRPGSWTEKWVSNTTTASRRLIINAYTPSGWCAVKSTKSNKNHKVSYKRTTLTITVISDVLFGQDTSVVSDKLPSNSTRGVVSNASIANANHTRRADQECGSLLEKEGTFSQVTSWIMLLDGFSRQGLHLTGSGSWQTYGISAESFVFPRCQPH
jgi:hypothetical protein